MDNSKHTYELWTLKEIGDELYIETTDGRFICDMQLGALPSSDAEQRDRIYADARRIVACVNVCRGFSTDGLAKEPFLALREVVKQALEASEGKGFDVVFLPKSEFGEA